MGLVCILALVTLSGAVYMPATSAAVIENTFRGSLFVLDPGTWVWPFEPRLMPMVTRVTIYDLRDQVIEIGAFNYHVSPVDLRPDLRPGKPPAKIPMHVEVEKRNLALVSGRFPLIAITGQPMPRYTIHRIAIDHRFRAGFAAMVSPVDVLGAD